MRQSITKAVAKSDRKRGMTLGELTGVVQEAMRADLPLDSTLIAEIGWRGQVHKITIATTGGGGAG